MPQKRRQKGNHRDEVKDFQMMGIDSDFTPPAAPIATTSTPISISQWHIDDDRVHGSSTIALVEVSTAPSVTDSEPTVHETMFDYNIGVESTFEADENISPEHNPSAKKGGSGVSHFFHLTTILNN